MVICMQVLDVGKLAELEGKGERQLGRELVLKDPRPHQCAHDNLIFPPHAHRRGPFLVPGGQLSGVQSTRTRW
jgi:hypothetical protein